MTLYVSILCLVLRCKNPPGPLWKGGVAEIDPQALIPISYVQHKEQS
jgi:hypothetical protein